MINITVKTIFLFALLVLFAALARADSPSGHYENQLTAQPGLWDISGTYIEDPQNYFIIMQDDKGKITGQASLSETDGSVSIAMVGPVVGSIKAAGGVARVSLTMKFTGTASDGFMTVPVTASLQFVLDIDAATSELTGTNKAKVCVKARGGGCQSGTGSTQLGLPEGVDGTWDLIMDIQNANGKLTGTAAAILSNGRMLPLSAKGQYVSKTDLTKLSLKNGAATVTVQANAVPGALLLQRMTAKLLGQTIALP